MKFRGFPVPSNPPLQINDRSAGGGFGSDPSVQAEGFPFGYFVKNLTDRHSSFVVKGLIVREHDFDRSVYPFIFD